MKIVRNCEQCQKIDPAPVKHEKGELAVTGRWERIAVTQITHRCYTFQDSETSISVDCGPGRFSVWRKIRSETSGILAAELNSIFLERSPPKELLMDNSTSFRSKDNKFMHKVGSETIISVCIQTVWECDSGKEP